MTYILMKVLESAPSRYDLGIRLLTLGRLDHAYDRLAGQIQPGQRVLDIGCGTGALTLRAARAGAEVTGIDVSARMLAVARDHVARAGLTDQVHLYERGVAELAEWSAAAFDVVTCGLCLSELPEQECLFALREARRLLRPAGRLMIADETRPEPVIPRLLAGTIRLPLVIVTALATQTTTRALRDPEGQVREAGFSVVSARRSGLGTFIALTAIAPG